ncbi:MAG: DUF6864 domain-containing function [Hyphomonadaceae bacterium]
MIDEPKLPFPPHPNIPKAVVFLNGRRIIANGTLVAGKSEAAEFKIAELTFRVEFIEDGGAYSYESKVGADGKSASFIVHNFDNPLGMAIGPWEAGKFGTEPFFAGLVVQSVGVAYVLHYTFSVGAL